MPLELATATLNKHLFSTDRLSVTEHTAEDTTCVGSFLERLQITRAAAVSPNKIRFGSATQPEDLIVAYYYRAIQIARYVHECKLGYCRKSWNVGCKFNLPCTSVEVVPRLDETIDRPVFVRRYLVDDRYLKVHILELTLRTLSNIQTNVYYPGSASAGLNYGLKYSLKPETSTVLQVRHPSDDQALDFFRGQFVSLFTASTQNLGNHTTKRGRRCPFAHATWDARQGSSSWKHYLCRSCFRDQRVDRCADETMQLKWALAMATFEQTMRYFALDIKPITENTTYDPVQNLTWRNWDSVCDQPVHPAYNAIFSAMLPGDRVTIFTTAKDAKPMGELRRLPNASFGFGRFRWPSMAMRKDAVGRTERGGHFQTRLQARLNWHRDPFGSPRLICTLPLNLEQ